MKVKELIQKLSLMNQESIVVVRGYESGVDEVNNIEDEKIILNCHDEWYFGNHELLDKRKWNIDDKEIIDAVYITK